MFKERTYIIFAFLIKQENKLIPYIYPGLCAFKLLFCSFVFFLLKHVLGLILLIVLYEPDVHSSDSAAEPPPEVKSYTRYCTF